MTHALAAHKILSLCLLILLAACAPVNSPVTYPTASQPPPLEAQTATSPAPTVMLSRTPSPSTSQTSTRAANTPAPVSQVCSPLEGIAVSDLSDPDLLKTLFEAPRPGQDDGHHGVDFAYWSRGERTTMLGHPIQSVLDGWVAAVIDNRPPYGNAVIIETPLGRLPIGWGNTLPTPAPTVQPPGTVYCPPDSFDPGERSTRSLYLLYAHMNQTPALRVGQPIGCGETIGEVGTTGRSVNYHLHLETRVGPSGITFPNMAHYDNAATDEEMRNYCAWRISGLFQIMDPMTLIDSSR